MRFDLQAPTFDQRAGLPTEVCRAVARAVLEIGPTPNELLLEIGAGTGAIGAELLALCPRYVGIDLSGPMLSQFEQRVAPESRAKLIQSDAARPWPVASGSVGLVFGSRVLHFLPPEHVAAEAVRVASAHGLVLLVGRVRRDPQGPRARIRRQMRTFLADARVSPRDLMLPELEQRLLDLGGEPLRERRVTSWRVTQSPRTALDSWSAHDRLAGVTLPSAERQRILAELRGWAESTFGDLDTAVTSEEEYVLSGVRLAARSGFGN